MSIADFTSWMAEHIVRVHDALKRAGIPHAFGGAIANAFCGEPRGTTAIDINVFLPETEPDGTLKALEGIGVTVDWPRHPSLIRRDGQVRLRWDNILVDLFFSTFEFLEGAKNRARTVPFGPVTIPVLSAEDLVVCKVAFNRERDWIDLRNIVRIQGSRLDHDYIERWLVNGLGLDDPRVGRFRALVAEHT